ncbi:ATP synthase subunit I [Methylophilus sp.]|jgi:ATP synthase protein I|uniref:ATP synthase subunit I n=1 Tax=Methylophilus sp. TaxID=29541 RepID=UPI0011D9F0B1|nr:ATP synthase subunit I [Methylophilus sp.]TXI46135.1 MAG: ATP synthase subunit I [Methylophilus sp.]
MSGQQNTAAGMSLYSNMLRWQVMATTAVTLIAYAVGGLPAALSALMGGVSVVIGAWFATRIAEKGREKTDPTAVLLNLLKAEAVKIVIIAIILFVVFKLYQALVPFALIAGLAAAALFSGAALAKSQVDV